MPFSESPEVAHASQLDHYIDLWSVPLDLSERSDEGWQSHADWLLLSPDEQERAMRIIVAPKRAQFIGARAGLRRILASYLAGGGDPAALEFTYEEHGRPRLAGHDWLQFNLSHSSSLALVAVGRGVSLGIDVERMEDGRHFEGVARRAFSEHEVTHWKELPKEAQLAAFYRLWAHKEAYLKAWGTGLTFPSGQFTLAWPETSKLTARLVQTAMPEDDGAGWHFSELQVDRCYAAAVCWRGGQRTLCWRQTTS